VTAAVVVGALAQALTWVLIRRRGASIWTTTAPVLGVAGVVALVAFAVARPPLSGVVSVQLAVGVGFLAGVALYGATLAFVRAVAPRWAGFDAQARSLYSNRSALPPLAAIAVAAGVAAVGEELFWRGLVLEWAREGLGSRAEAGLVAWIGYVLVNLPSMSLPIIAGAVVAGAVWTLLALWSGGVVASIACHSCWAALMLARPAIREDVEA
jgi:membrane protease YdiL (CAAX protease family)